jgi:hypothetical protein
MIGLLIAYMIGGIGACIVVMVWLLSRRNG